MKTNIVLSFLLILLVAVNLSCDKLDIVEEFDIEIDFVANSTSSDFADTILFDATESSEMIDKYAKKIESIEILEVTVWLTSFNGAEGQKIVTSTLSVADENGNNPLVIGTVADVALESLLDNPMPLTINQEGVDYFAELIKNDPHKALAMNVGSADSAPISFTSTFKFRVKMTANPL